MAVLPSTGGIDWTQHGFTTGLPTDQPWYGHHGHCRALFIIGSRRCIYTNRHAGSPAREPLRLSGECPITLTVTDSAITADSKYFNISPGGTYAPNPTGLQVQAGKLTHPTGTESVAWVITAPSTWSTLIIAA